MTEEEIIVLLTCINSEVQAEKEENVITAMKGEEAGVENIEEAENQVTLEEEVAIMTTYHQEGMRAPTIITHHIGEEAEVAHLIIADIIIETIECSPRTIDLQLIIIERHMQNMNIAIGLHLLLQDMVT